MTALPYIFRWDRHGRKGAPCRVTARSRVDRRTGTTPILVSTEPAPKRFNSVRVEFADGYAMVTSGNAIRKAAP